MIFIIILISFCLVYFYIKKIGLLDVLPKNGVIDVLIYHFLFGALFIVNSIFNIAKGVDVYISTVFLIAIPLILLSLIIKLISQGFEPNQMIIFNKIDDKQFAIDETNFNLITFSNVRQIGFIDTKIYLDKSLKNFIEEFKKNNRERLIDIFKNLSNIKGFFEKEDEYSLYQKLGNEYIDFYKIRYQDLYEFITKFIEEFGIERNVSLKTFCLIIRKRKNNGKLEKIDYNTLNGSKSRIDDRSESLIRKIFQ